jgi:hypothetical protein
MVGRKNLLDSERPEAVEKGTHGSPGQWQIAMAENLLSAPNPLIYSLDRTSQEEKGWL